jgi:hypothetical protein
MLARQFMDSRRCEFRVETNSKELATRYREGRDAARNAVKLPWRGSSPILLKRFPGEEQPVYLRPSGS